MPINMLSGASCGVLGACFGSPFFLVKTRLQSYSPYFKVGTQHVYKNAIDGFRHIYSEEGVKGLFRGLDAAAIRTAAGSSVQLPVYFLAKRTIEKYGLMTEGTAKHMVSSAVSGFGVCCVMHPFDTIMTRMYNQRGNAPTTNLEGAAVATSGNLYRNPLDCFVKTIRTEGLLAVYKGKFM